MRRFLNYPERVLPIAEMMIRVTELALLGAFVLLGAALAVDYLFIGNSDPANALIGAIVLVITSAAALLSAPGNRLWVLIWGAFAFVAAVSIS